MAASEEKFTRQTLFDMQPLTPDLFTLRTSRDAEFRFRAGRFARFSVYKSNGSVVWRTYSMVSAPHDEFLDFFSVTVPGGEFTSELSRLHGDNQLLVDRQAFSFLILGHLVDGRDPWLPAIGAGVAPFVSILQDFEVREHFEGVKLVCNVCENRELAYRELIAGLAERGYLAEYVHKLQFIPVVTREQVPGCLNGRVITLIESGDLECVVDLELTPEHSWMMLCGNPQMIEGTRVVLKARGMDLSLTRRPGQVAMGNY